MIAAAVVEVGELLDVILYAFAATVGVATLFSLAVLGLTRASEQRSGDRTAAAAFGLLALVCLTACLAAAAWGIVLLASK